MHTTPGIQKHMTNQYFIYFLAHHNHPEFITEFTTLIREIKSHGGWRFRATDGLALCLCVIIKVES